MTTTKTFHDVAIKAADKGEVSAVIATVGVLDRDGDVMCDGCLPESKVAISPFGHAIWSAGSGGAPLVPLGYGVFKQDGDHLVFDGRYNMDTQAGREAFADVKMALAEGVNTEWSFSLQDKVTEQGTLDGRPANYIKSFRAAEVSRVLQGASIGSGTTAVKAAGLTFSEHVDAVVAAADELATRAAEVVALRAEKGKSMSADSRAALKQVSDRLSVLVADPDEGDDDAASPTESDDVSAEFLRFVAISQGVTL